MLTDIHVTRYTALVQGELEGGRHTLHSTGTRRIRRRETQRSERRRETQRSERRRETHSKPIQRENLTSDRGLTLVIATQGGVMGGLGLCADTQYTGTKRIRRRETDNIQ